MTLAWMLYALGVGALIAIAAVSAEWALKSAQKSVRFVWTTAIALTLVFTLVAPLRAPKAPSDTALPAFSVATAATDATTQPTLVEAFIGTGRVALDLFMLPVQKSMAIAKTAPRIANVSAGVFWVVSAVIALLVLVTVYSRSMRESLRWPRMNVLGRNVRVAPDVGPAVMGIAPPEIVIPRWVLTRNANEQRLVLEHESEHVRAHDPLLLVFACVAVALMPWNAAVWFMWSRLRLAVELDCDRRVLLRGVQKPAYGELLVELSSRRPWNSLAMPAFSWGTSQLEKRLVAMTARPVRFRVARRVASVGVIAIASVAACNSEIPTAAQVQAMDVGALAARVPLTDSTVYFVNGKAVSKEAATAVAAGEISSVEVKRATRTKPVAEVHVTLVSDSTRSVLKLGLDSGSIQLDTSIVVRKKNTAADTGLRIVMRADTAAILMSDSGVVKGTGTNVVLRAPACVSGNVTSVGADGSRIRIRGQSSSGAAEPCTERGAPLVVIDGVVMAGSFDMSGINPDRIASVEVIKGPSAANLYGPSAVHGVISIKLKK